MKIEELIDKGDQTSQLVRAALNILLESPYFYKEDDERAFLAVLRYRQAFAAFFDKFFGWTLVVDGKCARLYKPKWFNEKITAPNRDMFGFTKRDECIAFLLLLEFFEREAREQGVTADDRDNLRFLYGDLLEHSALRFRELLPEKKENYSDERVRQILRGIIPVLERYRFLRKVRPSSEDSVSENETIYEALPALWCYQAAQLAEPLTGMAGADSPADGIQEEAAE